MREIAKASPIESCTVVLEVGTIPCPDSSTSGKLNLIFAALYSNEFLFDTIPIKKIL